ncbi:MAG: SlyX family protein [Proteobacteria bacterium]|jgi:SlyX protein|nr:SlyX family protein [Pseudomonadota bacterium]MDA0928848.1 SlyX family protein [Pseudomonadota bacterium]
MSLEDKLVDLESRYSHQEDLLQQLNDIVASQGRQLDLLENKIQLMYGRISDLQSQIPVSGDAAVNEPPPHY